MTREQSRQLRQLLSHLFDGDFDATALRELQTLLEANTVEAGTGKAGQHDAIREYLAYIDLHSDLESLESGEAATNLRVHFDGALDKTTTLASKQRSVRSSSATWQSLRSTMVGGWAVVASLLLGYFVFFSDAASNVSSDQAAVLSPTKITTSGPIQASPLSEEFVAKIIRIIDCDWENARWDVSNSSQLSAGQTISITRGLMEIEFASGAHVTLEGPVNFRIESAMRALLTQGRLTAVVPEQARGFTISSPSYESIDLGTEFGLSVDADGVFEAHVFEGEVILRKTEEDLNASAPAQGSVKILKTLMAIRVASPGGELVLQDAEPRSFTRIGFDFEDSPTVFKTPLPVERKLTLWLAADRHVQRDERNCVAAWGDALFGENTKAENAWQVERKRRPRWVKDAINGRPALRFDGKRTSMITEPLTTTDEQTVFVVLQSDPEQIISQGSGPFELGQVILNYHGPPNIVLEWTTQLSLRGRNYNISSEGLSIRDGVVEGKTHALSEPIICAFVYSVSGKRAAMYENGVLSAETSAEESVAIRSSKVLGSHYLYHSHFIGDLAELLIFNAALREPEILEVSDYLATKYDISLDRETAQ